MLERVLVEFVSANPTGPAHVATGRHAAYGDSLARILEFLGNVVEREYYVNDFGSQVRRFGESIQARARGEEPPEDGYQGDYVRELASRIEGAADADVDELAVRGVEEMVAAMQATLERFGVHMDRFFFEHTLHEAGAIDRAIGLLEEREQVYPHEGAVWLRTTDVRRRQGPRAEALDRRVHVLRRRHRLPRGQARARLRPGDRRLGRRPPRLRGADARRVAGARRRARAGSS